MEPFDLSTSDLGVICYTTANTAGIYHRTVLAPGADLTEQPAQIVTLANGLWTAAVLAAYQASCAPRV